MLKFHYATFNAAVFLDPRYFALLSAEQIEEAKVYLYLLDLWERLQVVKGAAATATAPSDCVDDEDPPPEQAAPANQDEGQRLFQKLPERRNRERVVATGAARGTSTTNSGKRAARAALRGKLGTYDRTTVPVEPKEDVFEYWERQRLGAPELYELAMVVLSIPATQVSVERLFSALRFILRPQRYGLSAQHVDDVAFLNANADLVRDVVKELLQK